MAAVLDEAGLDRRSRVRQVEAAAGLSAILAPEVDLVLWQRRPPADLARLLDDRGPADLPQLRLDAVAPAAVTAAITAKMTAGLTEVLAGAAGELAPLVKDVARLARLYGRLFDRQRIRVRLETVTTDACSLFHVDRVRVRLLSTYVGPGTEWLGRGSEKAEPIHRFERFAVGLLKGSLWPGSNGCAHRSPPIAGTGRHRLLLAIDDGTS